MKEEQSTVTHITMYTVAQRETQRRNLINNTEQNILGNLNIMQNMTENAGHLNCWVTMTQDHGRNINERMLGFITYPALRNNNSAAFQNITNLSPFSDVQKVLIKYSIMYSFAPKM